jgi:hypothetical protein
MGPAGGDRTAATDTGDAGTSPTTTGVDPTGRDGMNLHDITNTDHTTNTEHARASAVSHTDSDSDDERVVVVRPRRGVINLGIDLTTLACLNDDPGHIPGFGPVLADIARQATHQMAEAAQWRFTVRDRNGDTVAEGRLRAKPDLSGYDPYRPSAAQRAFVNARDKTCRAPGCRRPALRCDQDHIRDWAYSHETTIANLCCLCRRHHRAKHVGGFRTERTRYGIDWITPRAATTPCCPRTRPHHTPHTTASSNTFTATTPPASSADSGDRPHTTVDSAGRGYAGGNALASRPNGRLAGLADAVDAHIVPGPTADRGRSNIDLGGLGTSAAVVQTEGSSWKAAKGRRPPIAMLTRHACSDAIT